MAEPTSAFPPPPPFYVHHTAENAEALAALPPPHTADSLPPESPLRFLIPPPPPSGSYYTFGAHWSEPERHASLEDNGITRLYPAASGLDNDVESVERVTELRRLVKSLLLGYLELVGVLGIAPEEFADKTADLQTILFNMHHLINKYRPHQARETLCLLLERQLERIESETVRNWDAVSKINDVVSKAEAVGREVKEAGEREKAARGGGQDETERRRKRDKEGWEAIMQATR